MSDSNYLPEKNREWRSDQEQELLEQAREGREAELARPTLLQRLVCRLRHLSRESTSVGEHHHS